MRVTNLYAGSDFRAKWYNHTFGWPVCVVRKHRWELTHRWRSTRTARMGCPRCGQTQWLEDVPDKWDGKHDSRRFCVVTALLYTVIVVVWSFLILALVK